MSVCHCYYFLIEEKQFKHLLFPHLTTCNTVGNSLNILPVSVTFHIYDWSWKSQAILCSSTLPTVHLCPTPWHPHCPTVHFTDISRTRGLWEEWLPDGKEEYLLSDYESDNVMGVLHPASHFALVASAFHRRKHGPRQVKWSLQGHTQAHLTPELSGAGILSEKKWESSRCSYIWFLNLVNSALPVLVMFTSGASGQCWGCQAVLVLSVLFVELQNNKIINYKAGR